MDRKRDIIEILIKMSRKYSIYEVYMDWIKCSAISISNGVTILHDEVWKAREQDYINIMHKYDEKERHNFIYMFQLFIETLESSPGDILGQIFMEINMGSKVTGQFFTPYHISQMLSAIAVQDLKMNEDGIYRLSEPSCGGGAMIIASAIALQKKGINYQEKMDVVAQDLDGNGVYMCYLQLSMMGIKAICVQGDSLTSPYHSGITPKAHILITPAKAGLFYCDRK